MVLVQVFACLYKYQCSRLYFNLIPKMGTGNYKIMVDCNFMMRVTR